MDALLPVFVYEGETAVHGSAKKSSNSTNDLPQGQTRGEKFFDRAVALGPHRGPKYMSWQKLARGGFTSNSGRGDGDGAGRS